MFFFRNNHFAAIASDQPALEVRFFVDLALCSNRIKLEMASASWYSFASSEFRHSRGSEHCNFSLFR